MKIFLSQKATFLVIFCAGFLLALPIAFAAGRFSDVPSSEWFASSVEKMADAGIVKGKSDGNFHPSDSVSRAEIAVMLDRMIERKISSNDLDEKLTKEINTSFLNLQTQSAYTQFVLSKVLEKNFSKSEIDAFSQQFKEEVNKMKAQ